MKPNIAVQKRVREKSQVKSVSLERSLRKNGRVEPVSQSL